MFRNQYILSNKQFNPPDEFSETNFYHLHICHHFSLNVVKYRHKSCSILLIGFIIDPFSPHKNNEEVIKSIAGKCKDRDHFFKNIQWMSGRFVLIFRTEDELLVTGDCCCLRQMYLHSARSHFVMTSSPKLFLQITATPHQFSAEKKAFIDSAAFRQNEHSWYGSQCIDDRLQKILPNHFFDIQQQKIGRIPFYHSGLQSERETLDYSAGILQGTLDAACRRYKLMQPVTGGWDTRMLLAAAKKHVDDIDFYIFHHQSLDASHPDLQISQKMMRRLGLPFRVIRTEPLTEEFMEMYKREHILHRILPKTNAIQHHFYHHRDKNIINLNGNCGAIARCHFGYAENELPASALPWFTPYLNKNNFVNREIMSWCRSAKNFASEYRIPLIDLFYWECRTGNWAPLYPFEQDIAIEELSPFNNRALLYAQLLLPAKLRNGPPHKFFRHLIMSMWPEVLVEPMNPKPLYQKISLYLKRSARMRYWKKRLLG